MRISFEAIKRLGACWNLSIWKDAFGDVTEVDEAAIRKQAAKVNWNWLAYTLLSHDRYNTFDRFMQEQHEYFDVKRDAVRDELPLPEGLEFAHRHLDPTWLERKRRWNMISAEIDNAYADAFFQSYEADREYVDAVIAWASAETDQPGPKGRLQLQHAYVVGAIEDDENDDDNDDVW